VIQESPTFMGWSEKVGAWAFSPSPINGATHVWDISDWKWEDIQKFMVRIPDSYKHEWLADHNVPVVDMDNYLKGGK
jgi:hypothetical protein